MGYACMAASPWLAEVLRDRYGAHADTFEFGYDPDTYKPLDLPRDEHTVVYYARRSTPRRASEMGFLALDEVVRRRPGTRVVLFGDKKVHAAALPARVRRRARPAGSRAPLQPGHASAPSSR